MTTKLKERPLVLTTEEVNAVLAGHKTQHRVPALASDQITAGYKVCYGVANGHVVFTKDESDKSFVDDGYISIECPFGKVGDRLWVQEDFIPDPPAGHDAWEDEDSVTNYFQWDGCGSKLSEIPNRLRTSEHVIYKAGQDNPDSMMWFNALQMRKWASRLLLEITDIRIERVQDITVINAQAEGSPLQISTTYFASPFHKACGEIMEWFKGYWNNKQSKMSSYEANPWVWVIEFKKVDD